MSSNPKTGGPAFPVIVNQIDDLSGKSEMVLENEGMTLRDWFAGMSIQAIVSNPSYTPKAYDHAMRAYELADAMILARNHAQPGFQIPHPGYTSQCYDPQDLKIE